MEVGNERTPLPGKITTRIGQGTLIIHEQAGAGGFGDPLARDPEQVCEDVLDGKITATYADHAARRGVRSVRQARHGGNDAASFLTCAGDERHGG